MPQPIIDTFGDLDHKEGETGLVIDGQNFGFPGSLWMFANENRTGLADQLTVGTWTDGRLSSVSIPASPNNSLGTVYLAVQNDELLWSFSLAFTLSAGAGSSAVKLLAPIDFTRRVSAPFGGFG